MEPINKAVSRRLFLSAAAGLSVALPRLRADVPGLRIGVTDWNLKLSADPEAVPTAARLGFQGVQVSFGRHLVNGKIARRRSSDRRTLFGAIKAAQVPYRRHVRRPVCTTTA